MYGVAENKVDNNVIIDVATKIDNLKQPEDMVMIIDATGPSANGPGGSADGQEKCVFFSNALESLASANGITFYKNLNDFVKSRQK